MSREQESWLNAIGDKHFEKGNFAFFENTDFYLRIPMKDTYEEDPWKTKALRNRRKFAFIFSNCFCRLISNYLGLLCLPLWGFY